FNGAAARTQRRAPRDRVYCAHEEALQWGRCANAAERHKAPPIEVAEGLASMGPLRERSGESTSSPLLQEPLLASMGPLRERSGEVKIEQLNTPGPEKLQWGRCANAAERVVSPLRFRTLQTQLQWGRCANAAESRREGPDADLTFSASMGPLRERSGESLTSRKRGSTR